MSVLTRGVLRRTMVYSNANPLPPTFDERREVTSVLIERIISSTAVEVPVRYDLLSQQDPSSVLTPVYGYTTGDWGTGSSSRIVHGRPGGTQ